MSTSHPVNFDECGGWIQQVSCRQEVRNHGVAWECPLTAAKVDARYPNLGGLMRKLKLEITDVLPYDEYGRCKDSHPDPKKRSF